MLSRKTVCNLYPYISNSELVDLPMVLMKTKNSKRNEIVKRQISPRQYTVSSSRRCLFHKQYKPHTVRLTPWRNKYSSKKSSIKWHSDDIHIAIKILSSPIARSPKLINPPVTRKQISKNWSKISSISRICLKF